ncbi:hypothetical protein QR66_17675 [Chromobacterium piscinae]|nr:hypothetical protein QR66_17675 [Chromobacterium piscinae]
MAFNDNFPHRLAILQVKLRAGQLKINEVLEDAHEHALVSTLMLFLDASNFRTPITKPRIILGKMSMLGKTALYSKLASLERKGLIERCMGERALRFSTRAVELMVPKEDIIRKQPADSKEKFLRVGSYSLPISTVKLLNKGLDAKQVLNLLAEAKKTGIKIQALIDKFWSVLTKYEGDRLFYVFRDVIRNTEKYQPSTPSSEAPTALSPADAKLLQTVYALSHTDRTVLAPGEKLWSSNGRWWCASPSISSGRPLPISVNTIDLFAERMREACLAHTNRAITLDDKRTVQWVGQVQDERPCLEGVTRRLSWAELYCRLQIQWEPQAPEQSAAAADFVGRSFIRKGIRYLVSAVEAGTIWLQGIAENRSWSEPVPLERFLNEPALDWCE